MFLLYFFFSLYSSVNRYQAQAVIFGSGLLLTAVIVKFAYAHFGVHGVAGANVISYSLLVLAFGYFHNRRKNVL
jgi:hypothetical protein